MTTIAARARMARVTPRHPWASFAVRRSARLLVSFWILITASFVMIQLVPGDPVRAAMGPTASPATVAARRHQLGLDRPLLNQYVTYLHNILTGHLGTSIVTNLPVSQIISQRLPATLEIAVLAFAVVMASSVPAGICTAVLTRGDQRPPLQFGFATVTVLFSAIPAYLFSVVLVYFFAVRLNWFPVAGRSGVSSYVLPVLALSLGAASSMARIVRTEMLSVLDADFMRTARAKRLPARLLYLRHALPNALTATLTISGSVLTGLMAGTVLVENVFAWPGLGSEFQASIVAKDYPIVQSLVLVYGGMILIVNLAVDVVLAAVDPRSSLRQG